jgi:hypothetical protein
MRKKRTLDFLVGLAKQHRTMVSKLVNLQTMKHISNKNKMINQEA